MLPEKFKDLDPSLVDQVRVLEALKRGLPIPPHVKAHVLEQQAVQRGLLLYKTFKEFVAARHPELLQHKYMLKQIEIAQRVIDGKLKRLIVFMPTQYGKSEIWSRLLPAYYLLKYAMRKVVLASFGAELSWELSSDARDYYAVSGGRFKEGSIRGAVRNWKTARQFGRGGGMFAASIQGVLLGRGYNLGIVDDPVSPEQATRKAYLERFKRWWPSQMLRGQAPATLGGSAIIFVMQRLDILDPARWLLDRELTNAAEHWHILCMDEVHSAEPYGDWSDIRQQPEKMGFPVTCTVEPDWREVGEILAPRFKNAEEVAHLQATAGPLVRAAQRQQRPMRPEGDFWQEKWLKTRLFDTLPSDAHNGGWDWDPAYTKDEANSGTAGIYSYRGAGKKGEYPVYITDVRLEYEEFPGVIKLLQLLQGPHYVEAKASGKSVVQTLKSYLIPAEEVKVSGDKLARASAAQPAVQAGRVYISRKVYEELMSGDQGLLRVTAEALQAGGEGLDVNDAFVQAIWRHLDIASTRKQAMFM